MKKNKLPKMNESAWYGKVAHYGDLRVRYRSPIIVFCESKDLAKKYFAGRAKTLPGWLGSGGFFPGELYCFPDKEKAEAFFREKNHNEVIFEIYVDFEE